MSKFGRDYKMGALFVVIGAVLGGLLGDVLAKIEAFSGLMPYLVNTYPVLNVPPVTIDLYIVKLTAGVAFSPNLMSILGIVLAIVLFRRYN